MNSFTQYSVKALRADIEQALALIGKKHNVIIGVGNARFSPTSVTFAKVTAIPAAPPTLQQNFNSTVAATATQRGVDPYNTLESREYMSLAYTLGLKPEWLGKKFKTSTGIYTVVGLKASRPKFPVIGVSARGTRYKFPASSVKAGIIL